MNIYKVSVKSEDFFKISGKIVASSIIMEKNHVYFKTDKLSIDYLKTQNVEFEMLETLNSGIKKRLFLSRGFIFGIILFASILYLNSFRISDVVFNGEYLINQRIEEEIYNECTQLYFFKFADLDYESFSKKLRRKYLNYQWIEVTKKGSKVVVNITDFDDDRVSIKSETIGDIVASKDGVIRYFNIYQGGSNVEINKYVKKGEVLISSDLLFNKEQQNKQLVEAKGLVIADTYETVTMEIEKTRTETIYTGLKSNHYALTLFGKDYNINSKKSFDKFDAKENTIFNLFGTFKIKKIEELEKCDIIKTYTLEEAIELVSSVITEQFEENRTNELEKIMRLEVLTKKETNNSYVITMLVKKQESIGAFSPL